ncbi:MAG: FtsX-like permease family protein [Butyribacter sp.]
MLGGDKAMFILFDYIVIAILAFVFAITTSNTIIKEAGVIGTLRASGYTRGEIIRHYMINPVTVTLISAIIGNVVGYTVMVKYMASMYYNSYSLPTYNTLYGMQEAFMEHDCYSE